MSMKNVKFNHSKEVKFNAPSNRRKGVVARSNKPALMTLTCHKKCGKCLSFGREVFEKWGGYDERLTRNQDNEMNYRIRKNGGKIYL